MDYSYKEVLLLAKRIDKVFKEGLENRGYPTHGQAGNVNILNECNESCGCYLKEFIKRRFNNANKNYEKNDDLKKHTGKRTDEFLDFCSLPIEQMAIHINDKRWFFQYVSKWRLKIGK